MSHDKPAAPPSKARYQHVRALSSGGMGEVSLARTADDELVALKRILPAHANDANLIARFLDEANVAARLRHPALVHTIASGVDDDGPFIAMEYLRGTSLRGLFRVAEARRQRIPIEIGLGIVVQACEGLAHAHDLRDETAKPLGIVHRDVSPENLLLSEEGDVKVADFGIATAACRSHHTTVGLAVGKCAYMAPEHLLGQPVDRRADVFSLGVVLHELLTSRSSSRRAVSPPRSSTAALPCTGRPRPEVGGRQAVLPARRLILTLRGRGRSSIHAPHRRRTAAALGARVRRVLR